MKEGKNLSNRVIDIHRRRYATSRISFLLCSQSFNYLTYAGSVTFVVIVVAREIKIMFDTPTIYLLIFPELC